MFNKSYEILKRKLTPNEMIQYCNNEDEYTSELLEIFSYEIEKHGKKNIKLKLYDYIVVWDIEEKHLQKTYRYLKEICIRFSPKELRYLSFHEIDWEKEGY